MGPLKLLEGLFKNDTDFYRRLSGQVPPTTLDKNAAETIWQAIKSTLSSKTKGPGEKVAPRNHPKISSQKLADFECRFPYDSYAKGQSTSLALFRKRSLGQYPAAPCSPGPFGLLLKLIGLVPVAFNFCNFLWGGLEGTQWRRPYQRGIRGKLLKFQELGSKSCNNCRRVA